MVDGTQLWLPPSYNLCSKGNYGCHRRINCVRDNKDFRFILKRSNSVSNYLWNWRVQFIVHSSLTGRLCIHGDILTYQVHIAHYYNFITEFSFLNTLCSTWILSGWIHVSLCTVVARHSCQKWLLDRDLHLYIVRNKITPHLLGLMDLSMVLCIRRINRLGLRVQCHNLRRLLEVTLWKDNPVNLFCWIFSRWLHTSPPFVIHLVRKLLLICWWYIITCWK